MSDRDSDKYKVRSKQACGQNEHTLYPSWSGKTTVHHGYGLRSNMKWHTRPVVSDYLVNKMLCSAEDLTRHRV